MTSGAFHGGSSGKTRAHSAQSGAWSWRRYDRMRSSGATDVLPQQAHLLHHRGGVPVVGVAPDLFALELEDGHASNQEVLVRRRHAGEVAVVGPGEDPL